MASRFIILEYHFFLFFNEFFWRRGEGAVLDLHCCAAGFFSSCGEQGLLFTVLRLLIAVVSLAVEHGL